MILEVVLGYPNKIHELYNDYTLSGEKIEVKKEALSDYQLKIKEGNNFSLGKNKKLFPNLDNKSKYILHYQT